MARCLDKFSSKISTMTCKPKDCIFNINLSLCGLLHPLLKVK